MPRHHKTTILASLITTHTVRSIMETIVRLFQRLLDLVREWFSKLFGTCITLDNGKTIRLGPPIAQGGFSIVYQAYEHNTPYALKRLHCPDRELLSKVVHEMNVHRKFNHPNLMPLLGSTILNRTDAYMLFPLYKESLRNLIDARNPLLSTNTTTIHSSQLQPPFTTSEVLTLFYKICSAVQAFHQYYSHRDIKVENILLDGTNPILMDFGSAGELAVPLHSKRDISTIVEEAATHTTISYRPPELFEGGCQVSEILDYRTVDVWSLGCTLFTCLYGASPFECDFSRNSNTLLIKDCTHLSILGDLPKLHPPVCHWYNDSSIMTDLIVPMLHKDRTQRPTVPELLRRTQDLLGRNHAPDFGRLSRVV